MSLPNDTQKALKALQLAGAKGMHSFHLNHFIGTTRAAARIQDLKDMGYNITSKRERMGNTWGCRYYLMGQPVIKNTQYLMPKGHFVGSEWVEDVEPRQEVLL